MATIIGTQGDDVKTTNSASKDMVMLLGGNDIVSCDFQTPDYIVGGEGNDILITGGAFNDFKLTKHPSFNINGFYFVKNTITNITNVVKGIESFRFTEGDASTDDFLKGISPAPKTFDKTVSIEQFDQTKGYHAENGVAEQFLIDLSKWKMDLKIDGLNASEDQLVIVSTTYTNAKQFIEANMLGNDTWGWSNGNVYLYNPEFSNITLSAISGSVTGTSIYDAESAGWLKFGQVTIPPVTEEKLQINISNFVNSIYNATDASEVITIAISEWNSTLTITNFDASHDKLVIASGGKYTSAASYISASMLGADTWGYVPGETSAFLMNHSFEQLTLADIVNLQGTPTLSQAESQGWIQFI